MIWFLMFGTVFLAELPDKTSLATLALLRQHRAVLVWIGAGLALIAQTIVALTAGRLLALVPRKPLAWLEIALFLVFAIWLYKESTEERDEDPAETLSMKRSRASAGIVTRTFVLVFLAEFFDLTQLATMAYAARYPNHLIAVGVIAAGALLSANGLVVIFGHYMLRRIPGHWMQRIAAAMFGVIAVVMSLSQLGILNGL